MRLEHPATPNDKTRLRVAGPIEAATEPVRLFQDVDTLPRKVSVADQERGGRQPRDTTSDQVGLAATRHVGRTSTAFDVTSRSGRRAVVVGRARKARPGDHGRTRASGSNSLESGSRIPTFSD